MLFFLLIRVFKSLSGSDPRLLYIVSEWVAFVFNPFRVDMKWNPLPRVERHNAPLNPGLRDEAPLGLSEPETHAVTAEPFRPARGGGLS